MRVLLGAEAFQNAHQRGIQRYFREMVSRLPLDIELTAALRAGPRAPLPARARVARVDLRLNSVLPRPFRPSAGRLLAPLERRLARSCDVYHATYYTRSPLPALPAVLTVYDMIAEQLPEHFSPAALNQETCRKRQAILAARRIIAISQDAARALVSLYPAVAGRTVVIPLGHEHALPGADQRPAPSPLSGSPCALFVGDRAGYKNFRLLLDAAAAAGWPSSVRLAVVGAPWGENERRAIQGRLEHRIMHLGRVDDGQLRCLYAAAMCVIVPSRAEGFGLPIIEAQAAGAPVVCSDIPIFREVAAGGALYFDPSNPQSLAAALNAVCNPAMADGLRAAGRANLPRFTWSKCAQRTAEVYREIATCS
jgi:glycosyltransferase involved in cell wall biosynthesis